MDYITGEQFQLLCGLYCGNEFHLNRNPRIKEKYQKHCNLDTLNEPIQNPPLVFCYSACLTTLYEKLHFFKNKFVLVSHNEDENITDKYLALANSDIVVKWFAQNVMFHHHKLHWIPIGMANRMWEHGNLEHLHTIATMAQTIEKQNDFFLNFRISTNPPARRKCMETLTAKGLHFQENIPYNSYLQQLALNKFTICPPGNGIDCHRIWEAYAVGTIPILLRNVFSEHLQSVLPCILLNSWDDFSPDQYLAQYETLKATLKASNNGQLFSFYKFKILQSVYDMIKGDSQFKSVFCFIGTLPSYALASVHQLRLFTHGPIYFIVSDDKTPLALELKNKYHCTLVPYSEVVDEQFTSLIKHTQSKFCIVQNLIGREKLFIYSFERFYLLRRLAEQFHLKNVFFLEVDNTVYADPNIWFPEVSKHPMCFMFDNVGRYASGICFFHSVEDVERFTSVCNEFILTSNEFMTEMTALALMRERYPSKVHMLPILWPEPQYHQDAFKEFDVYGNTVFDAAGMGIYIGGMDPHHTKGVIQTGLRSTWSMIDYTQYNFGWKEDALKRKIPYIQANGKEYQINNLHIHSKALEPCLSLPLKVGYIYSR